MTTSIPVFVVVIYATSGSFFDNDTLALFENPKVEQTEMSYKCLRCTTNLIQSHMEFHVQKKLIKDDDVGLVAVSFAFIGKMIKAIEYFVQESLHKHYSICKLPFLSQDPRFVRSSSTTMKLHDCLHLGRSKGKFSECEIKMLLSFLLPLCRNG